MWYNKYKKNCSENTIFPLPYSLTVIVLDMSWNTLGNIYNVSHLNCIHVDLLIDAKLIVNWFGKSVCQINRGMLNPDVEHDM